MWIVRNRKMEEDMIGELEEMAFNFRHVDL
jgi:hypothetical protein